MVAGKIHISKKEYSNLDDKIVGINTTDEFANYLVAKPERTENIIFKKYEQTPLEAVDYSIVSEESAKLNCLTKITDKMKSKEECDDYVDNYNANDRRNKLSFMNVNTIEEGVEWYKKEFPQLPDQITEIMARWNWGDLSKLSKKQVKKDIKKPKKFKEKYGLEAKQGNFVVNFS